MLKFFHTTTILCKDLFLDWFVHVLSFCMPRLQTGSKNYRANNLFTVSNLWWSSRSSVWLASVGLAKINDNHRLWHNLTLKLPRVMYDLHCLLITIRPLPLLIKETYELSASLHESFFGKHLVLSSIPKLGKPGQTKCDVCAHNISSSLSIPNPLPQAGLHTSAGGNYRHVSPSTGNMPVFSH